MLQKGSEGGKLVDAGSRIIGCIFREGGQRGAVLIGNKVCVYDGRLFREYRMGDMMLCFWGIDRWIMGYFDVHGNGGGLCCV